MVGDYRLRNPALAPTPEILKEIEETTAQIRDFAAQGHTRRIRGKGDNFKSYRLDWPWGVLRSASNLSPMP